MAFGLLHWVWPALYSVFMLDKLQISYTEISIFNAFFMATSIVGYRIWAGLIDRFGSKAVLQIIVVLASTLIPFIWIFNVPDSYYLVPVALVLSGVFFSGIGVAISPLVYSLLPQGEKRTLYLASWSVAVNLMGALGPFLGSILAYQLQDVHLELMGFPTNQPTNHLCHRAGKHASFPYSCCAAYRNTKDTSSRRLISQIRRGNLLKLRLQCAPIQHSK